MAVEGGVHADRERTTSERQLRKLEGERKKLLDAHYADAIPLDLLKSEQARIATQVASIEGRLVAVAGDFKAAEINMRRALQRAGDCEAAYRDASDKMHRQFNLAFFKRLIIGDDYSVTGELAEPFDVILSEELRRAAIAGESEALTEAVDDALRERGDIDSDGGRNEQRPREPEGLLVGAGTPGPSWDQGSRQKIVVRMRVQRRNHDGLLEHLMEPVARQARRRAAEMIRDAA